MATHLDISSSFTGKVVKAKVSMMFNDAGLNKNGFQIPGTSEEAEERIIAAPFIFNDEVLGAICLNRIGPYFSKNDLNLLDTFANYVTTTVKNAQNYHNFQHEILERTSAEKAKEESERQFMDLRSNLEPLQKENSFLLIQQWFQCLASILNRNFSLLLLINYL
jgi:transcriptional regulator with GAF, ATPase, and Fis domain